MDGSGYIMVNAMAVDAQVLVTMDASMLRGLLVLKTTKVRTQTGGVPRVAWEGVPGPCAPEAQGEAFRYPLSPREPWQTGVSGFMSRRIRLLRRSPSAALSLS